MTASTAGKTTLADELAERLGDRGRPVIRAGIDGFHCPRAIRYRRGPESPDGYYLDSFDLEGLKAALLEPLGPEGSGLLYRPAIFDHRTDTAVHEAAVVADQRAILLFDGVFLLRPELRMYWDFAIVVKTDFAVAIERAIRRDLGLFGSPAEVVRRYETRYVPGQQIYLRECRPEERADIVIDNNDPENPAIERRAAQGCTDRS